TVFRRVLDVGCGSGVWLIETARTYPNITKLYGVDVSMQMISWAASQAKEAGVSDRVKFQAGDALRMLDFESDAFDLVNMRFGVGWLRKWDWPRFIRELQRVARADGIIRITASISWTTNSPPSSRF